MTTPTETTETTPPSESAERQEAREAIAEGTVTRATRRQQREAALQEQQNEQVAAESQGAVKFHTRPWRSLRIPGDDGQPDLVINELGTTVPGERVDEIRELARKAGVELRES